ncbi:hypothetical protein GCM10023107_51370 [Actinoplanes octamycinicus]|nr:hypothetical protein Aoc01nite_04830 [Actinoplanes octamycinicus]
MRTSGRHESPLCPRREILFRNNHEGPSDVRLSEVSSAAKLRRDPRPRVARWSPRRTFRVDETGAGEYSPPTQPLLRIPTPIDTPGAEEWLDSLSKPPSKAISRT